MSRYYSPERGFTIYIKLWIHHFRNQAQFFNSFGFFVILCSLNGLQTIATVDTINFRILCFIKILPPLLGWQNLDRAIAYTRFHRIKGGDGVPPPPPSPTNNFDRVDEIQRFL